jgi:hypothetical protein
MQTSTCTICGKTFYTKSNFLVAHAKQTCSPKCYHINRMNLQRKRRLKNMKGPKKRRLTRTSKHHNSKAPLNLRDSTVSKGRKVHRRRAANKMAARRLAFELHS